MPPRSSLLTALALVVSLAVLAGLEGYSLPAASEEPPNGDSTGKRQPDTAASKPLAHPLDPLTAAELDSAISVLRAEARATDGARFPVVALHEPSKETVAKHRLGDRVERQAFVSVFDPAAGRTHEAVIDLAARKTISWKELPGVQPPVLVEEYAAAADIVRADPRWQAAMRRRGLDDFAKIQLDAWAGGSLVVPGREGARLLRVMSYLRTESGPAYGRPIEGVLAAVDMRARQVADFIDRGPAPIPNDPVDIFNPKTLGPPRAGLKPLTVKQDQGPSFTFDGNEVRWQNWRFRFALHPREGLVLYTVGYEDGGKLRPILHRASLSEMLVPYGDADAGWNWRNAFDQGEYGLGQFANTLRAGDEAPENATLVSAVHADESGKPTVRKDIVALYEQDGGILWRHLDYESLRTVSRRARQLVVQYVFTVGNYDYGLQWIFHQDGTLEARVELTGILLAKGVDDPTCAACRQKPDAEGRVVSAGADRHGTLVAKNVVAPNHQHFFCFRLDLDVDGTANSVAELDMMPEPDAARNPAGNAFLVRQQRLRTETEARRSANPSANRCWKVFNPNATNALGHYAGYLIEPGPSPPPFALPDSAVRRRGRFIEHALWVTRHSPDELHAAGPYPSQRQEGDGLPRWSQEGESLENVDVVAWHVLGVTHMPRVEEWPVMSTARAGFKLVPHGFFARNPALDVPEAPRP